MNQISSASRSNRTSQRKADWNRPDVDPCNNLILVTLALAVISTLSTGCATPWGKSSPASAPMISPPTVPPPLVQNQQIPSTHDAASTQPSNQSIQLASHNSSVQQTGYGMHIASQNCASCATGNCGPGMHAGSAYNASGVNHAGPCTAGCCGPNAPVYPCMPPMSAFGIDPQEFLCDGGDRMPNAAVRLDDRIIGVGLEDTVVKYETQRGTLHVEPSNRVCIYAPRFASVRRVNGAVTDELATGPVAYVGPDGPGNVLAPQPSSAVMGPVGPEHKELAKGPDALRGRDLGVPIDMVNGPVMAEDVLAVIVNLSVISHGILRDADRPWLAKTAQNAQIWSLEQAPQVVVDNVQASVAAVDLAAEGITGYELPGGRLRVTKVADRQAAKVGDIVTFVIRIDNTGDGRLSNVVLTDNLTTRLQYIPDSQTCAKGVKFETEENDGGSLRLTWKFTDDFEVGEGTIIRFRCRVR